MTVDPNHVFTRDLSSGRVHLRVLVAGKYASLEADNADDAGEFEVITAEQFAEIEAADLCRRCFPEPESA